MTKRRMVPLVVAAGVAAWVVFFSIDRSFERTTDLPNGLVLVRYVHVERSPISDFGCCRGSIPLPIPHSHETIEREEIRMGDATIWLRDDPMPPSGTDFLVAPDDRHVLMYELFNRWEVLNTKSRGVSSINMPETDHTGFCRNVRWAEDSSHIACDVDYQRFRNREAYRVHEVWQMDPTDGQVAIIPAESS